MRVWLDKNSYKNSMEPLFHIGDRVIARAIKRASQIKRGTVVVFHDDISEALKYKRVIGLPGERLKIDKGETYIDGVLFAGRWKIKKDLSTFGPIFIPINHYFLIGDNRGVSVDSRKFGPVPISNVLYKALAVYWPIRHFKILI